MLNVLIMLLAFIVGSVITLIAYTKGLQHNYNLKHDKEPKISNPIKDFMEVKMQDKEEKEKESFMKELLVDPRDEV